MWPPASSYLGAAVAILVLLALCFRQLRFLLLGSESTGEPPQHTWKPPGCTELLEGGIDFGLDFGLESGLDFQLPLADPAFREICTTAKLEPGVRGRCYRFRKNKRVLKCLPSFLVVGFTKAGTSVFFQYASQHHLVRTARLKEPAYLGSDVEAVDQNATVATAADARAAGDSEATSASKAITGQRPLAKTLRWYMNLFPSCPTCERGEATPGYAWRDYAAVAAAQARLLLGGATKLFMLVREPIDRAASHYVYFREKRRAFRVANLSKVLHGALDEFERCAMQLGGWRHQCTYRSGRRAAEVSYAAILRIQPQMWRLKNKANYELLQAGLYSEHWLTWRAQFPASSILVIDMALLRSTPLRAMRRFERHLGLPHFGGYEVSNEHALASLRYGGPKPGVVAGAALHRNVDEVLRTRLEHFFAPFNRKLKKATGVGWTYESGQT